MVCLKINDFICTIPSAPKLLLPSLPIPSAPKLPIIKNTNISLPQIPIAPPLFNLSGIPPAPKLPNFSANGVPQAPTLELKGKLLMPPPLNILPK